MTRRLLAIGVFVAALALAGLAWVAGFATGVVVGPAPSTPPVQVEAPSNFGLFDEAWGVINREFYGSRPVPAAVASGAVDGLVSALEDPYATHLRANERESGHNPFAPRLIASLGTWVEPVADGVMVLAVVPGSAAAAAPLQAGDVLLAVGDEPLAGLSYPEAMTALEGDPEKPAEAALVFRRGDAAPQSLELGRAAVSVPDLEVSRPRPGVLLLRPSHFDAAVVARLDEALSGLAAEPAEAIVLDLRDNPGGDLDSVRQAAGRFMSGELWREVNKSGTETVRDADETGAPARAAAERLVALVNGGTVGGAEILAGALRDRVGARLIGTPTFGKGTIQSEVTLPDNGLLRLTVAKWRTPAGTEVDGAGLRPDDVVDNADKELEAALAAATGAATAGG